MQVSNQKSCQRQTTKMTGKERTGNHDDATHLYVWGLFVPLLDLIKDEYKMETGMKQRQARDSSVSAQGLVC